MDWIVDLWNYVKYAWSGFVDSRSSDIDLYTRI